MAKKVKKTKEKKSSIFEVLEEVNNSRTKKGLKPLTLNTALSISAMNRAKEIYESQHWSHTTKEGRKFDALVTNKQDYSLLGENLARKFKKTKNMVKAWSESPNHSKNMYGEFEETGIGTYGDVTVQFFGKKR